MKMIVPDATLTELIFALRRIAGHSGEDFNGTRDEWTEARAFVECRDIARSVLTQESIPWD